VKSGGWIRTMEDLSEGARRWETHFRIGDAVWASDRLFISDAS
jgi:hypothetical protein